MTEISDREFYCSADQDFFYWLRTRIFKTAWSTQIFVWKLMKLMQKWKSLRNKVSSPKESKLEKIHNEVDLSRDLI